MSLLDIEKSEGHEHVVRVLTDHDSRSSVDVRMFCSNIDDEIKAEYFKDLAFR